MRPSVYNSLRDKNWISSEKDWRKPLMLLHQEERVEGEMFIDEPDEKPHKGRISNWTFMHDGVDEYVVGLYVDHPRFAGNRGHTSYVRGKVLIGDGSYEIETLNSKYTLLPTAKTCEEVVRLSYT